MSLALDILKVRKAFSEPKVPHNPRCFILMSDLVVETELNRDRLSETLEHLERARIVEVIPRSDEFPAYVQVLEKHKALMGVEDR